LPELPEVEVLVQHLASHVIGRKIRHVEVRDRRSILPTRPDLFKQTLNNASFLNVTRRGKYLIFTVRKDRHSFPLIGHLGMTGRIYLAARQTILRQHSTLVFGLGHEKMVFEDMRRFGRMGLDASLLDGLGVEPLDREFTENKLGLALARSRQPIKVILLDQSIVAGIGNIYASEALFRAGVHPGCPAHSLGQPAIKRLRNSIRRVLREAIRFGSTVPLSFGDSTDGLFYFGQRGNPASHYEERLRVYNRHGKPCVQCGCRILRIVQAARSTYFCPQCQQER